MFHSLFNVSIFDMTNHNLLMFGITLRRLKFPANVRVHIHKSEKLIFVYCFLFYFFCFTSCMNFLELQTVLLDLNGLITVYRRRVATPCPEGCSALIIGGMITPNPFSFLNRSTCHYRLVFA